MANKIGRNEPCPCGSGRKYKHCCLGKTSSTSGFANPGTLGGSGGGSGDSPGSGSRQDTGGSRVVSGGMSTDEMKEIMLAQTGFSDTAELEVAMSEYERFCESRDDDGPPPTFMEYLGRPNAATQSQKSLTAEFAGRDFESEAELNSFLARHSESANTSPIDDFEGLSSHDMHLILTQGFDGASELFEFSADLSDGEVLFSVLTDVSAWVLAYFADQAGEMKLTTTGNFNRALCRAYCNRYPAWYGVNESIPLETSLPMLYTAHELLLAIGYTAETAGRAWMTTEGVDVYSRRRWSLLYREAMRYMIDEYDWKTWLPDAEFPDHFNLVQDAAPFLLYLLYRYPEGNVGKFIERIYQAFPEYIVPAQDDAMIDFVSSMTAEMFFARFCVFFGLVEFEGDPSDFPTAHYVAYHVTPLFRRVFTWKR